MASCSPLRVSNSAPPDPLVGYLMGHFEERKGVKEKEGAR